MGIFTVSESASPTIPVMKRSLGFFLVHTVLWTGLVLAVPGHDRIDYDLLGDASTPWVRQFVVALLAVLILQTLFMSREKMWKDVLRDSTRSARPWMWIPAGFVALIAAVALLDGGLSDAPTSYWIGMSVTMLLVGVTEEVSFRGILAVGARRDGARERTVLLLSSGLFGLFHLPNWLLGQDMSTTIRQVVVTAIMGAAFYALRRASGTLVLCIVLHAAYDWVLIQRAF